MELNCIQDALGLIKSLESESKKALFRGHSKFEWDLMPSVGRCDQIFVNERSELEEFKKKILHISKQFQNIEYFQEFGTNDFSLLSWAQHYEMFPTRFLDWTDKILIALFFACKDHLSCDGCVWMFIPSNNGDPCWKIREMKDDPLSFEELKIFFVPIFIDEWRGKIENKNFGNRRPQVQRSIMTIHPKDKAGAFESLERLMGSNSLVRIKVPLSSKNNLLKGLSDNYYINQDTVLDGKTIQDIKSDRAWKIILQKKLALLH